MRLLHAAGRTRAVFDEPNLIAHAGLVPVMRLAQVCGLEDLAGDLVRPAAATGVNAGAKITAVVAGMAAGADSIDGLGVLRHGAMGRVFGGIRAPSTLGSFLRGLTYGNACQAEAVSRQMLARLASQAPVLPGADVLAVIDIDSVQRQVHGPAKQGAGFGHAKVAGYDLLVRGLNALIATISTVRSVSPVIACTRLRGGSAASARGGGRFAAEAITTAREAGCGGQLHMRGDSAFYTKKTIAACRRAGVFFSFTVKMDPAVKRAIASVSDDQWTGIKYPQAVWDEEENRWISDAQIAEAGYTAFASDKAHPHRPPDRPPGPPPEPQGRARAGRAIRVVAPPRVPH
ncbi:MAG: transposase [Streptosporangiaceae bacterium]